MDVNCLQTKYMEVQIKASFFFFFLKMLWALVLKDAARLSNEEILYLLNDLNVIIDDPADIGLPPLPPPSRNL